MIELTNGARYEMENPEATSEREQAALADVLVPKTITCTIPMSPSMLVYPMWLPWPWSWEEMRPVSSCALPVWLL